LSFARALGDAIVNPPERHSLRWWVSRVAPPTAATLEFIMAVATLLRHSELGQLGQLLVATNILDKAVATTHIDPAVTLAMVAITHIGGNRVMALLETLLRPLLNAQLEAGIEKGKAEGKKEFEAWKARQRAAGVHFVEDDPADADPPPERSAPH
jgi:hypothetical protein